MGMMLSAPAGNDILFDESLCEQGQNFCIKIWNAFRLVKGWKVKKFKQPAYKKQVVKWFEGKLRLSNEEINHQFQQHRISEALMAVFRLFRDDFSNFYLEIIKPNYKSPIDSATYGVTLKFFDMLLNMLHPFMPFINN